MPTRQTVPQQWLIVDRVAIWPAVRKIPRGSGVLLLKPLDLSGRRWMQSLARARKLAVVIEQTRTAARIHNQRELTQAMLRRPRLVLVSPIFETASHPDWPPLPRMRAAAFARLTRRKAIALGGMNRQRYAKIAPLGFIGWAGISAFRT
jgi:thiamine-phosphate pyrophosphorylase